jgi:predicted nucleotidyltransferase
LEAYTFISRYPFVYPSQKNAIPHEFIHIEDAQTCLDIAQNAYDKISGFLLDNADYPTEIINTRDYYFTAEEVKNRIDEIVVVLSEIKQISVEKIILFGTFAREKDRPKMSTMDILVIGKTDLSFIDRIEYVREATKGGEPILEPLVYTPEEFNYMLNDEVEGFLETAIAEGKVIYENPSL